KETHLAATVGTAVRTAEVAFADREAEAGDRELDVDVGLPRTVTVGAARAAGLGEIAAGNPAIRAPTLDLAPATGAARDVHALPTGEDVDDAIAGAGSGAEVQWGRHLCSRDGD